MVLVGAIAAAAGGCGFRPLYGKQAGPDGEPDASAAFVALKGQRKKS